ncbi:MAG TPA: M56 family metallopeptidase [Vicinamibacterales bacterium]|nr:M56 family metallopeptidase [Vicinamibacterales bacterium]
MTAGIFDHLWQSTVCAGVVALLSLALRRNRARLRYGIWFVASVKFLVPFAALAAAGSLLEWRQAPAPIASVVTSPAVRAFQAPFAELSLDSAVVAATPGRDRIASTLFAMWMCGFAVIVVGRVKQWRRIRATVRASAPWDATTDLHSAIRIRTAPTVLAPGVVGLWKPVILLPKGIDTYLTRRQLAAVLAHEVCHARRRDNLTAAVHMLVEALFWFHPMVWWIGSRLIAEREQACDEHVVAETAEPIAYAEGIVTICRRYAEAPLMSVAGVGGADVKARIDAILANRIGLRLTLAKRLVLATAAVLTLVVPIVTGAIDAQDRTPVGPPIDPETRFEVVSIKPFDASGGAAPRISMLPNRYDMAGMPTRLLVSQALITPPNRIIGLPDWIDKERYTIAAKVPEGTPGTAMFTMITNLLKDRFKLTMHRETREMPVYNLVFARSDKRFGPAFKETSAECRATIAARLEAAQRGERGALMVAPAECVSLRFNPGIASIGGAQMAAIAGLLTQSVGRPVIDKTGLTSYYDATLKWTPAPGSDNLFPFGLPAGAVAGGGLDAPPLADPDAPNLFTAVQDQLGLKLESARGRVEFVVIDRLEKPTLD